MQHSQGASKWAENVGRQALLRFWGGRTSQAPPPSGSLPGARQLQCRVWRSDHGK